MLSENIAEKQCEYFASFTSFMRSEKSAFRVPKCRKRNTDVIKTVNQRKGQRANEDSELEQAYCLKCGKMLEMNPQAIIMESWFTFETQNKIHGRCRFQIELQVVYSGLASPCRLPEFFAHTTSTAYINYLSKLTCLDPQLRTSSTLICLNPQE